MDASVCWELFRETGQPVFYLLYRQAAEAEAAPRTARDRSGERAASLRFC